MTAIRAGSASRRRTAQLDGRHEIVGVGAAPVALDGLDPGAAVAARPADVGREDAVAARDEHPRVELGRRRVRAVRPAVRREHHRRSLARAGRLEQEGRHAAGIHLAHDRGGACGEATTPPWLVSDRSRPSSTAHTSGGLWSPVAVTMIRPAPTESADTVVSPVVAGSGSPLERDAPHLVAAAPVHDREDVVAVPVRHRVDASSQSCRSEPHPMQSSGCRGGPSGCGRSEPSRTHSVGSA